MSINIRDYRSAFYGGTEGFDEALKRLKKKYAIKKLLKEFPEKNWSEAELRKLLKKIDDTGGTKRKQGSRRPRTSRSDADIDTVKNLILSQKTDPGTHLSLREIEMETGRPRASDRKI